MMEGADGLNNNFINQSKVNVKTSLPPTKITDVFLEEETLTLWRPATDTKQYYLIPETLRGDEWPMLLQLYYTKFDCISCVLPFDDAIPVITHQATTLLPTQDYSILRNYPRIKGLWFRPDRSDSVGLDDESMVGNIKFSFTFPEEERENLLSNMNIYLLEVLDYESDDKSVSRFLITKEEYKELPKYNIFKPGGPIFIQKEKSGEGVESETYYFLKICQSYKGKAMEHVVELILEEDPWPMCKISSVTHKPLCSRSMVHDHTEDLTREHHFNMRYFGAAWDQTLAGLFAWSLRTNIPWLVYERLHDNIKGSVNLAALTTPFQQVFTAKVPAICSKKIDLLFQLAPFVDKCENQQDLVQLKDLHNSLHTCSASCTFKSLKNIEMNKILTPYLSLLERVIACVSVTVRRELMNALIPWSVMAFHFHNHQIESCMKMVGFIYQLEGIRDTSRPPESSLNSSFFFPSTSGDYTTDVTSGIHSLCTSPVTWEDMSP